MVKIDFSLFIQIANFLVLLWALNIVLYRPIRRILGERRQKISWMEEGILKSEQNAADKDKALKDGIKQAREKGLLEKEASEEQAREEEKRLIAQINEKAKEELAEIREAVKTEAEAARSALQKEIEKFADDISSKILGRTV